MCTFHLTMERADAVRGLARSVRPVLERFELVDLVPEPWLHLTMNGLGFADEVPDDRLEAVADEVFACQMNVHDSEHMAGLLEASGYRRVENVTRK